MAIDERLDRTMLVAATHGQAEYDDVAYWMSKTPAERIEALEYMRRWVYGDNQIDARLQRVFVVTELEAG